MSRVSRALTAPFVVAFTFALASLASAQTTTTTWVSGLGADTANAPCSRYAPCRTFATAMALVASGGRINVLDPGGFGSFTITKSVTIDGLETLASIVGSGGHAITINITDPADSGKVRIRGMSLNGLSRFPGTAGILVRAALDVVIADLVIDGFTAGIDVSAPSVSVLVRSTTIRNNSDFGVFAGVTGSIIALSNVNVVYNGTGVFGQSGGIINSFGNNVFYGNTAGNGSPNNTLPLK